MLLLKTERRSLVASASLNLSWNSLKEKSITLYKFIRLKSNVVNQKVWKKKYLQYHEDMFFFFFFFFYRKPHHLGHCSASFGKPHDADQWPSWKIFYPHYTPMKDTYSLAHGLRHLTRDVKVTSELSISEVTSLMRYHEKQRMTFVEDRYAS